MSKIKEYPKQQHCSVCNRYVKFESRYVNYACDRCILLAVDKKGRALRFVNTTIDGHGCQAFLSESNDKINTRVCFIKGIKFKAYEGYLGGIVLIPKGKLT